MVVSNDSPPMIIFSQTCDKDYDRHTYKIHMESGKVISCEWYEQVYAQWFSSPFCKYVEVIDKKQRKGFK